MTLCYNRTMSNARKMTDENITQAVLMRCRGMSYWEIGESLGWAHTTIAKALNPAYRKSSYERSQAWRISNPERNRENERKQYAVNPAARVDSVMRYYKKNKQKVLDAHNERTKARRKVDPQFRIACNLRTRMAKVLKRGTKSGSAIHDLGCTLNELRVHLEFFWEHGMSWENYGRWHIDHVKPLAAFDLTDREQFLQAVHYTNLQPLWAEDNIAKGAKLPS